MKENINVLDEINKGACMGIDAISYIIDKVKDKKFKKLLERQSSEYKKISEDINEIYSKYNSDDEPHETNKMEKTMTWFGIEMRTMTDDSDAKISELLFNGTNMGILEGRRILNDKKMDKEVTCSIAHVTGGLLYSKFLGLAFQPYRTISNYPLYEL